MPDQPSSNTLAVPSRAKFLNEKYSGGADPEIRVRTHIIAEDNQRIGTGESIKLVETSYGRMLVVDSDPFMSQRLTNLGVYAEDEDIKLVYSLLSERPRGVFIDVGANLGCWSLGLVNVVDKVISIEPQTTFHNLLCGSVVLNGLSRKIFPKNYALGDCHYFDKILTADLESYNNFGGVSLVGQVSEDTDPRFTEIVEVRTLDSFVQYNELVSFIKIDVEGFEDKVLDGATNVIERCKPIMFIEWALSDELKLGQQIVDMGYVLEYREGNWLCLSIPE